MAEYTYTYEDIIIDPKDNRIERAIGKEVYFGNLPRYCIQDANENNNVGILREIVNIDDGHFCVKTKEKCIFNFECIIIKQKESEHGYIPFRNAKEFLEAYLSKKEKLAIILRAGQLSQLYGVRIKKKDSGANLVAKKIWDEGIAILGKKLTIKRISVFTNITTW